MFKIFKDVIVDGFTFNKFQFSILPKDEIKIDDFDFNFKLS